jgi:hypothetical protein
MKLARKSPANLHPAQVRRDDCPLSTAAATFFNALAIGVIAFATQAIRFACGFDSYRMSRVASATADSAVKFFLKNATTSALKRR